MKFLTANTCIKSVNEQGEISGYASVFNVVDGYNDAVIKGAFLRSINHFKLQKKPKLLWQHNVNFPIGVIDELYEDDYGLFVKGHLLLDIPKSKEIYSLLKNKAIDGFSIGYKVRDSFLEKGVTYLSDIDLFEISIVTFPACQEALVSTVKSHQKNDNAEELTQYLKQINFISNKVKKLAERNLI